MHGSLGSWPVSDLNACVDRCRACKRCTYVSFNARLVDCSWFSSVYRCGSMKLQRNVGGFTTHQVRARDEASLEPFLIGHGYCTHTNSGAGDCLHGNSGSWPARQGNSSDVRMCAALCDGCARCAFFSHHPGDSDLVGPYGDCSWYGPSMRCDTKPLLTDLGGFTTFRAVRQPAPNEHKDRDRRAREVEVRRQKMRRRARRFDSQACRAAIVQSRWKALWRTSAFPSVEMADNQQVAPCCVPQSGRCAWFVRNQKVASKLVLQNLPIAFGSQAVCRIMPQEMPLKRLLSSSSSHHAASAPSSADRAWREGGAGRGREGRGGESPWRGEGNFTWPAPTDTALC